MRTDILKLACAAVAVFVTMAGTAVPVAVMAQTQSQAAPDQIADPETTVVAKVGSETVYLVEVLRMAEQLPEQYRRLPLSTVYPNLLQRAVDARLVARAGRKAGYAEHALVKERLRVVEGQIISEVYLKERIGDAITEEMLQEAYTKRNQGQSGGEELKARHVLVDSEAEAREIIGELEGGADFATLASERSTGPSATSGGDLGWFGREQMVPEFSDAAFSLESGRFTSEPVKTQFGWHVILVEDRRETAPPSFDEMRQQLAGQLSQERLIAMLEDLRTQDDVTLFSYDGSPLTVAPKQ